MVYVNRSLFIYLYAGFKKQKSFLTLMVFRPFFNPRSVAIIGASRTHGAVGNVIADNFVNGSFSGKVYLVNPKADELFGEKVYHSVLDISSSVELGVIAVPAKFVIPVVNECGKKGIRSVIIITSGFSEVGNEKLQNEVLTALRKNKIRAVGPNCLGVYDGRTGVDTVFLPRDRIRRPSVGGLSIVTQSGALGSTLLDLCTLSSIGVNKFVSYGNALDVDVHDLLDYLADDDSTTAICVYVEGLKDGKAFMDAARKVTSRKPVIILKGGTTEAGGKAALSHTASLAGEAAVYGGAFKQVGCVIADTYRDFVDLAEIFSKAPRARGGRVAIVTNSGGHGILVSDAMDQHGLAFASLKGSVWKKVGKELKPVPIKNPLDLLGDATSERYKLGLDGCIADKNVDVILLMCMPQTPLVDVDSLLEIVEKAKAKTKKPIICVTSGSTFAEELKLKLEKIGLPCYYFPEEAVASIAAFVRYWEK
jgi:acetate---CoA ligase (ADP-forming)